MSHDLTCSKILNISQPLPDVVHDCHHHCHSQPVHQSWLQPSSCWQVLDDRHAADENKEHGPYYLGQAGLEQRFIFVGRSGHRWFLAFLHKGRVCVVHLYFLNRHFCRDVGASPPVNLQHFKTCVCVRTVSRCCGYL